MIEEWTNESQPNLIDRLFSLKLKDVEITTTPPHQNKALDPIQETIYKFQAEESKEECDETDLEYRKERDYSYNEL